MNNSNQTGAHLQCDGITTELERLLPDDEEITAELERLLPDDDEITAMLDRLLPDDSTLDADPNSH